MQYDGLNHDEATIEGICLDYEVSRPLSEGEEKGLSNICHYLTSMGKGGGECLAACGYKA